MITTAILTVLGGTLYMIFSLLPQVTSAPSWWTENIAPMLGVVSGLNSLPILGTVGQIILVALSILIAWQAIVFLNWIYNKIRGSG